MRSSTVGRSSNPSHPKTPFLDMVRQMDSELPLTSRYCPKAVLLFADDKGRGKLSDIVAYPNSTRVRRAAGLVVEKANSIYAKGGYTDAQAQRNILSNPFKRFEDMQMLHHQQRPWRDPGGRVRLEEAADPEEKQEIERICDEKLSCTMADLGCTNGG